MKQLVYLVLFFFGIAFSLNAQTDRYSEVYKTLKANDSLLFDRAFNHCETQYLKILVAEDFEFYHDKSGVVDSKDAFIKIMQNGICNPNNTTTSKRELVDSSLDVFPLYNNGQLYGALQNGVHKFYETTNGKEVAGSIAKFSHLWILEDGTWYLKRVISFNHQTPMQNNSTIEISDTTLDTYAGEYKAETTGIVKITKIKNGLHINAGQMDTDVYATSQTAFTHPQAPLIFEFIINSEGSVQKFIVRENGKIVEEAIKL